MMKTLVTEKCVLMPFEGVRKVGFDCCPVMLHPTIELTVTVNISDLFPQAGPTPWPDITSTLCLLHSQVSAPQEHPDSGRSDFGGE